ncbi:MAG TPA: 23S rRNA (uracil(1939)-C(5))-methyltransferase RlmD [Acidobacteriaceae bacterium]|nr:23S rRNA (uracil(1939)-C(5))-methyltransferase RlmD [Acidobacteriaceae bacterium]
MKLRIEKMIYGGAALARAEGKAVFVPFALPGETVEARVSEEKRGYATAEIEAVTEASAERVPATCRYFGACGGCQYQHANYAAQVEMKRAILRETLERARIREIPEIAAVTSEPFGYRNRLRLHVQRDPFALCYKRRNSNVNLPVKECPIAAPVLQRAMAKLHGEGEGSGLAEWARSIELFTNEDESALLVALWTERDAGDAKRALTATWPKLRGLLPEVAGAGAFSVERRPRASRLLASVGEESLRYRVGEHVYRVSLGSFFQASRFALESLVQLAVGGEGGGRAWDLYAGVGLFSVPLAEKFNEVTAVEVAASSVRDLRENLRGVGQEHRSLVVAAEASAFLQRAVEQREAAPDLVVVDPPRDGLGAGVTSLLGKLRPPRITYVSCDPSTLSRDLAALLESGYRLGTVHLVDLFPQTFHLETVAHLTLG